MAQEQASVTKLTGSKDTRIKVHNPSIFADRSQVSIGKSCMMEKQTSPEFQEGSPQISLRQPPASPDQCSHAMSPAWWCHFCMTSSCWGCYAELWPPPRMVPPTHLCQSNEEYLVVLAAWKSNKSNKILEPLITLKCNERRRWEDYSYQKTYELRRENRRSSR